MKTFFEKNSLRFSALHTQLCWLMFFFQKKILKHSFFWFFDIVGVRECERVGGKEDKTKKAIFEITERKIFWCWFRLLFCDSDQPKCVRFHILSQTLFFSTMIPSQFLSSPLSCRKPFETSTKKKTNSLKHFLDSITFTNSHSKSLFCQMLPSNLFELNFAGDHCVEKSLCQLGR